LILVITNNFPQFDGGSGEQKVTYLSYNGIDDIYFLILNDINHHDHGSVKHNFKYKILGVKYRSTFSRFRFSGFFDLLKKNNNKIQKSKVYLHDVLDEIMQLKNKYEINTLVVEQTGILNFHWAKVIRKLLPKAKLIIRIHDSHYFNILADIKTRKSFIVKIGLFISSLHQFYYEKKHMSLWDKIIFISLFEYQSYSNNFPKHTKLFIYQEPGYLVNNNIYKKKEKKEIDILFVGSMNWKPNMDAFRWFSKEILPIISDNCNNISFCVAGKNSKEKINTKEFNVKVLGEIIDLNSIYMKSKIVIVPTISGGGIKIKLLEAISLGMPVVATERALVGFPENYKKLIYNYNNATDFAEKIVQLLSADKDRILYSERLFNFSKQFLDSSNYLDNYKRIIK